MTTIAYHHESKIIAYDSRLTIGDSILTDEMDKLFKCNGYQFVMCGSNFSDVRKAVAAFPSPVDIASNPYGLLVDKGQVFWVNWVNGEPSTFPVDYNVSAGSGEAHAITAMDMGAGAATAIDYAVKRDISTGGVIRTLKV